MSEAQTASGRWAVKSRANTFGDRQRVARVSRVPRLLDPLRFKAGLAHEPCDPLMVDRFALSP